MAPATGRALRRLQAWYLPLPRCLRLDLALEGSGGGDEGLVGTCLCACYRRKGGAWDAMAVEYVVLNVT
jgi:hypothetical protein